MYQGRDTGGFGSSVSRRRLPVAALCRRGATALALVAVVWWVWTGRGAVAGVPEALGCAIFGAKLTVERWAAWKVRHPLLDRACFFIVVLAVWLLVGETFYSHRSLADLLFYASAFASANVAIAWRSERKRERAARTAMLGRLATDFGRHLEARRRAATEGGDPADSAG